MSSIHAVLGRILGGDDRRQRRGGGGGGDTRESAVAYHRVRLVRVDDRSGPTDDSSSRWRPVVLVLIVGVRGRLVLYRRAEAAPRRPAVVLE